MSESGWKESVRFDLTFVLKLNKGGLLFFVRSSPLREHWIIEIENTLTDSFEFRFEHLDASDAEKHEVHLVEPSHKKEFEMVVPEGWLTIYWRKKL